MKGVDIKDEVFGSLDELLKKDRFVGGFYGQ